MCLQYFSHLMKTSHLIHKTSSSSIHKWWWQQVRRHHGHTWHSQGAWIKDILWIERSSDVTYVAVSSTQIHKLCLTCVEHHIMKRSSGEPWHCKTCKAVRSYFVRNIGGRQSLQFTLTEQLQSTACLIRRALTLQNVQNSVTQENRRVFKKWKTVNILQASPKLH